MLPVVNSCTQGSPFDGYVTAALVRLASRIMLPLQMNGVTAVALPQDVAAPRGSQSCVGFALKGMSTLQLELISVRSDDHKKPAWLLLAQTTEVEALAAPKLQTLLQFNFDALSPWTPFSQWVAALDAYIPGELQRSLWLRLTEQPEVTA